MHTLTRQAPADVRRAAGAAHPAGAALLTRLLAAPPSRSVAGTDEEFRSFVALRDQLRSAAGAQPAR